MNIVFFSLIFLLSFLPPNYVFLLFYNYKFLYQNFYQDSLICICYTITNFILQKIKKSFFLYGILYSIVYPILLLLICKKELTAIDLFFALFLLIGLLQSCGAFSEAVTCRRIV